MWLLLRVLAFAASVPLLTRMPWPRLQAALERRFPGPGRADPLTSKEWDLVGRIDAAMIFGHPLVRPGCLACGLTRYFFLRQAGVQVSLWFGIPRTSSGSFPGHCWLELQGEPILEAKDPRLGFLPIHRLPSPVSDQPLKGPWPAVSGESTR